MANVLVDESALSSIASAIREKNGTETTYKPSEMAPAIQSISSGGDLNTTIEGGDCRYFFAYHPWFQELLSTYHFTFNNPTTISYMFSSNLGLTDISNVNFNMTTPIVVYELFGGSRNIERLPQGIPFLHGSYLTYLFTSNHHLTSEEINKWFSVVTDYPASVSGTANSFGGTSTFSDCFSIRNINPSLEKICKAARNIEYNNSVGFFRMFSSCIALDEIKNVPVPRSESETSNNFDYTFELLYRVKDIIFDTDNGIPYTVNWKSQVIDLKGAIGWLYSSNRNSLFNYNSGITADKEVTSEATYQALKNDPDWFTTLTAYSRYNHDSAVRTINSLPDTSAYLTEAGGTNTIKFKGEAGSKTDGGAINTLTDEEIAVATTKGWTVTLI